MLTSPKPISIPFCTPGSPAALERDAVNAINAFTRTRMREDGFFRRIMPPLQMSNDELDRSVPTDRPVRVVDAEERGDDSPAAISIPFPLLPENTYIRGPRYPVTFDRIVTPNIVPEEANG